MTKKDTTLEEDIEKLMKDESGQSKAISSLIEVKKDDEGLGSQIELRTDLTIKDVCLHTRGDMMSHILEMSEKEFSSTPNLIKQLIKLKERKLLSKDRKSRGEIVEVAKSPDMNMGMGEMSGQRGGFFRRRPKPM